jgi:hypothetical protein
MNTKPHGLFTYCPLAKAGAFRAVIFELAVGNTVGKAKMKGKNKGSKNG